MSAACLRPQDIKDARAKREQGQISADDLKAIEDKAISRAVAKEASLGLKVVTDGEYRRSFWSRDFFRNLDNVETYSTPNVKRFQGSQPKTLAHRPTARLGSFYRPPDDRSLSIPQIGSPGRHGAENDHSGAERISRASRKNHPGRIGVRFVRRVSTPTLAKPIGRSCALSATPVAVICSSTKST